MSKRIIFFDNNNENRIEKSIDIMKRFVMNIYYGNEVLYHKTRDYNINIYSNNDIDNKLLSNCTEDGDTFFNGKFIVHKEINDDKIDDLFISCYKSMDYACPSEQIVIIEHDKQTDISIYDRLLNNKTFQLHVIICCNDYINISSEDICRKFDEVFVSSDTYNNGFDYEKIKSIIDNVVFTTNSNHMKYIFYKKMSEFVHIDEINKLLKNKKLEQKWKLYSV